jgi:hypothetical protein
MIPPEREDEGGNKVTREPASWGRRRNRSRHGEPVGQETLMPSGGPHIEGRLSAFSPGASQRTGTFALAPH